MRKTGPITGTFIDEITYDIPSSNWGIKEWKRDLDNMQRVGIDTLIFIRGGFENKSVFPSKMLGNLNTFDFADFIFSEAAKRKMDVYFGMYISNIDWNGGDYSTEISKNKIFMDEVWTRYGHYPSFKGWYIPQECSHDILNFKDVMRGMSALCKDKTPDKKVLISPFFRTKITDPDGGYSLEENLEEWDKLFSYGGKDIDICAFQDGTAPLLEMNDYFSGMKTLANKHGIEHWVNVELFERDVRAMYYPIPFNQLSQKIEKHKAYADKMICFEYSHFLSPQSIYPSARNLSKLYKRHYL